MTCTLVIFFYPAGIYLLKDNNKNTRTRCVICSKLTGVFIVNFEHISHLVLVSLLLTLNKKLQCNDTFLASLFCGTYSDYVS